MYVCVYIYMWSILIYVCILRESQESSTHMQLKSHARARITWFRINHVNWYQLLSPLASANTSDRCRWTSLVAGAVQSEYHCAKICREHMHDSAPKVPKIRQTRIELSHPTGTGPHWLLPHFAALAATWLFPKFSHFAGPWMQDYLTQFRTSQGKLKTYTRNVKERSRVFLATL